MRTKTIITLALLLGCHGRSRLPSHVACVGDSITAGVGASSRAASYPSDLQDLLGAAVQVQNFGHPGATLLTTSDTPYVSQTEYGTASAFAANANAVVILMLGSNDSKLANWNSAGGTRRQQLATDVAALIDHFTALPFHPVVYLALPPSVFLNPYGIRGAVIKNEIIPVLEQVARQKHIAIIDLNSTTAAHPEYFADGVHPNDAGYKIVAQLMRDALLR